MAARRRDSAESFLVVTVVPGLEMEEEVKAVVATTSHRTMLMDAGEKFSTLPEQA